MKRLDEGLELAALRRLRRASLEYALNLGPPDVQRPSRPCIVGLQVNAVVDGPAEIEDSEDRPPLRCGKHQKRIVEAGLSGHVRRQKSARSPITTASVHPSVGRARKTSKRLRSRRSRMRTPPSQVARNSQRRRPRTASGSGRPCWNS